MKNCLKIKLTKLILVMVPFLAMISCEELVEEGYRIDYPQSDASLKVEALDFESGAPGNIISYKLSVSSNQIIKSCVVQATNDGANGSGFDVGSDGYDDPFADHNYGTVKKDISSFVVKYDYIIPEGINKSKITFSVIDDMGKVSQIVNVNVVPSIRSYANRSLYARNNLFFDAFASIDGLVYPDIKNNYSTVSTENVDVQEKIDIIFFYDKNSNQPVISSPADDAVNLELQVENATRFKILNEIGSEEFNSITPASLVYFTQADSITYKGSSKVSGFKVGDIIGFSTDVNAIHSLKSGLIRVNGLHPVNVGHYEGTAYVMECDIITQIDQ